MKYLALGAPLLFCMACMSCKGRTMENMEPTGDTVEVVIGDRQQADSAAAQNAAVRIIEAEDNVAEADAI